MTDTDGSDETHSARYTVTLNGSRYALNTEIQQYIQRCAKQTFGENTQFSCFWKLASPDQYETDEEWDDTVHDAGDPVLVIETYGRRAPYSQIDTFEVETQRPSLDTDQQSQMDQMRQEQDTDSQEYDRTHFQQNPDQKEFVATPEGEHEESVPPAPDELGDEATLVKWLPEHPDINHRWSAGETLVPTMSWIEWNVQQYANQPNPYEETANRHDHWESLLQQHDCEIIETDVEQPSTDSSDDVDDMGGKFDGNNWQV